MLGILKCIKLNNGCRVETVIGNDNEMMIAVAGDSSKVFTLIKCISRYLKNRNIRNFKSGNDGSYSFIVEFKNLFELDDILKELEELLRIL